MPPTTRLGRLVLPALGACLALATVLPAGAEEVNTVPRSPAVLTDEVTGRNAVTNTETEWGVGATDLGIIWESEPGKVLMAFGDTFAHPGGDGAGFDEWRSNVLFGSSDSELDDGMALDWALTGDDGQAKEIVGSLKDPGTEHTTIPTGAIAVDGRQYLAYMSVREWGAPGEWWTNHSQLLYSDDGGETWTDEGAPRWDNDAESANGFQMVAFEQFDGHVYMFGTPNGRFGAVRVARVPEDQMLDKDAYRYFDGTDWVADEAAAAEIIPAAAAELSARHDEATGKWQLITLNGNADLVLRIADNPTGPWGEEQILATQAEYPGLYGGYIHPWSPEGEIHFAMSLWNEYNVAMMKVEIDDEGTIIRPNLLVDPSFERSTAFDVPEGWRVQGNGGIDTVSAWAKLDRHQFWVRSNAGTHQVTQQVAVTPNTPYRLTGWLTTGDSVGGGAGEGMIGARQIGPGAQVLAEETFTDLDGYTKFVVEFTTDDEELIEVYAGSTMTADRWVQGDDFSLVALGDPEVPEDPEPTQEPTEEPTDEPTEEPTEEPTDEPTGGPTTQPTSEPTGGPGPRPGLPSTGR